MLKSNTDLNERNSVNMPSGNLSSLVSNERMVHTKSGDELSGKKMKIFDLASITNKLYRFRKKK